MPRFETAHRLNLYFSAQRLDWEDAKSTPSYFSDIHFLGIIMRGVQIWLCKTWIPGKVPGWFRWRWCVLVVTGIEGVSWLAGKCFGCSVGGHFFVVCLPPELLPVLGPSGRWCASLAWLSPVNVGKLAYIIWVISGNFSRKVINNP